MIPDFFLRRPKFTLTRIKVSDNIKYFSSSLLIFFSRNLSVQSYLIPRMPVTRSKLLLQISVKSYYEGTRGYYKIQFKYDTCPIS